MLVFFGVLLAQLLYLGANWLQYKSDDYGWYLAYLGMLLLYFLLLSSDFIFGSKYRTIAWSMVVHFVRAVAFASYAVYFRFIQQFLNTRERYPALHMRIRRIENGLWVLAVLYLGWEGIFSRSPLSSTVYFALSLLLFFVIVWFIAGLWKSKDRLSMFVLRGAAALAIGAFLTNLLLLYCLAEKGVVPDWYFSPLLAGILVEIFYFNNGLTYKSRQLELQLIASKESLIAELR